MQLQIVERSSREATELFRFEGALYEDWVTAWRSLPEEDRMPFSDPVWAISAFRASIPKEGDKAMLFTFHDGGRFVGAIPLLLRRLRTPFGYGYWLSAFYRRELFASLVSFTAKERDTASMFRALLNWRPVAGDRPLAIRINTGIPDAIKDADDLLARQSPYWFEAAVVDVKRGYDEIARHQSRRSRQNIHATTRQLNMLPGLSLETHTGDELAGACHEFAELEAQGWKRDAGIAMRVNPHQEAFFASLVEGAAGDGGELIVYSLQSDEGLLSSMICYRQKQILYILKTTYNESFKDLSPGKMIADLVIRDCCSKDDVRAVDFMHYRMGWHHVWKAAKSDMHKMTVCRRDMTGYLVSCLLTCHSLWWKLRQVLRARAVR